MGGKPSLGRMMKRICWWLVDVLSRMLDADERQAVRGDLAESGESVVRVIRDVLDLIVRRQVGLWAGWQPWLALLGIACLAGVPLSRIAFRLNVDLGQQLMGWFFEYVTFTMGHELEIPLRIREKLAAKVQESAGNAWPVEET
jgi:hypothetical protein